MSTPLDYLAAEALSGYSEMEEPVMWSPQGSQGRNTKAIVNMVSTVIDEGDIVESDGVSVTLNIPTEAFPGLAIDDVFTVRGTAYRVAGTEPNGWGRTLVVLGL